MAEYAIGLDYGTHGMRAVLVGLHDGQELATAHWTYASGSDGMILSDDPHLARHHPADYIQGTEEVIKSVLEAACDSDSQFDSSQVVALGVAATGSTPLPLDRCGEPLAMHSPFGDDLNAMAWLWKDHTAIAEAEEITLLARRMRPQFLNKCGGSYSSEWFFSKILHCLRHSPQVFDAAYTWVEASDWIPAMLTGQTAPDTMKINVCAAGHKAMFHADWGGYPDEKFLGALDPKLANLRSRLQNKAQAVGQMVGGLSPYWANKTGLPEGIAVATGSLDTHLAALGAGIKQGTMIKMLATGGCDMIVVPPHRHLPDIPGLCGIVSGGILPDMIGLEAGQNAVGDIYNWFVNKVQLAETHASLTEQASRLAPGASGLLGLDWHNGNKSILADPQLSGMMLGHNIFTTPAEMYRGLIEATAFGALTIINRLEQYNIGIDEIVCCGGIAENNPMVMQIYADVTNRPMKVARSVQASAVGASIAAATAAGRFDSIAQGQQAMTGLKETIYQPAPAAQQVYRKLYVLYKQIHDAFGTTSWKGNCGNVMKELLEIRRQARNSND